MVNVQLEWLSSQDMLDSFLKSSGSWETLPTEIQPIFKISLPSKDQWITILTLTSSKLISMYMKDGTIDLGKLEATRNTDTIDSLDLLQTSVS